MNNIYTRATIHYSENVEALENSQKESWVILCDFDGTISLADVTDVLLTKFGKAGHVELEEKWLKGEIGSRECMREQIALIDANKAELDNTLANIVIDPDFKKFVAKSAPINMLGFHLINEEEDLGEIFDVDEFVRKR